jgi:photosystem II stability/assembly factor-like uncharacterized protein
MLLLATDDGIFQIRGRSTKLLGLKGVAVHSIAVHPYDNSQILATSPAADNHGVFLSPDGGRTFDRSLNGFAHSAAWDPEGLKTYAGLRGVHIWEGDDRGHFWQELDLEEQRGQLPPPHFTGHPYDILSLVAQPPYLYFGVEAGGLICSSDGGKSFRLSVHYPPRGLTGPHQDIHSMDTDRRDPRLLYVATGQGFYRTSDGGQSWEERNEGLTTRYLNAITTVYGYPGVVLTGGSPDSPGKWNRPGGARARLFRSFDGGTTWKTVSAGLPAELEGEVGTLISDPTTPGRVLLGTWHNLKVQQGSHALYESHDAGESWRLIAQALPPINRGLVLPD